MIALRRLGVSECFDYIYGFSAGAYSAAYLLSDNPEVGTSIYYEDLTEGRFINPFNVSNMMNIDYLCDQVVKQKKKLNYEKIKNSKTLLKIFVTNKKTGESNFFTNKDDVELLDLLKATAAYPGFCISTVEIDGCIYIDGNVMELIPIQEAIDDGCTHILVISTVPEKFKESRLSIIHLVTKFLVRGWEPGFKNKFKHRIRNYNKDLDIVFGRERVNGINIYPIAPKYTIGPANDDPKKLKDFAIHGLVETEKAFRTACKATIKR